MSEQRRWALKDGFLGVLKEEHGLWKRRVSPPTQSAVMPTKYIGICLPLQGLGCLKKAQQHSTFLVGNTASFAFNYVIQNHTNKCWGDQNSLKLFTFAWTSSIPWHTWCLLWPTSLELNHNPITATTLIWSEMYRHLVRRDVFRILNVIFAHCHRFICIVWKFNRNEFGQNRATIACTKEKLLQPIIQNKYA